MNKRVYVYFVNTWTGHKIVLSFNSEIMFEAYFEHQGYVVLSPDLMTTYYYLPERVADFIPTTAGNDMESTQVD